MRRTILPLLVAALVAVAGALGAVGPVATASAASASSKILSDCTDGTIDGSYSKAQLQAALEKLSSDAGADDYSSCNDVIAAALADGGTQKKSSGSGSGSSTGSSAAGTVAPSTATGATSAPSPEASARAATPAETTAATQQAAKESLPNAEDLDLSGVKVPASALDLGASGASLPTPLIVALVAFALAAAASGLVAIRQAVRRRRGH